MYKKLAGFNGLAWLDLVCQIVGNPRIKLAKSYNADDIPVYVIFLFWLGFFSMIGFY